MHLILDLPNLNVFRNIKIQVYLLAKLYLLGKNEKVNKF